MTATFVNLRRLHQVLSDLVPGAFYQRTLVNEY